jgi:sn-glycerol 3-phosphate transport system permease protein
MVERTPVLDAFAHLILIAGAALVCIPIYFVFVTGTLTQQQVLQVPMPWVPGDQFMANVATAWQKADFGRLFLNSLVVSAGIVVGKIALSLLAAFAVTYFRFPFRMTAFWLIFVSLMLPIEVRIVPTSRLRRTRHCPGTRSSTPSTCRGSPGRSPGGNSR